MVSPARRKQWGLLFRAPHDYADWGRVIIVHRIIDLRAVGDHGKGITALLNPYASKKANVRISMLSRGRASGGLVGSTKEACAVKRALPSFLESNTLNTNASSRFILGK